MRTLLVAFVVLFAGCDSNYDDDAPSGPKPSDVVGNWIFEKSYEAVRLNFDGVNFELDYAEMLNSGSVGMLVQKGTYTVTGSTAQLRLRASSCQGVEPLSGNSMTLNFARSGDTLTVTMGTLYMVMQLRTAPPTSMASATIGCFDDEGYFTPHATTPLP